jgi:tetratricopeptide (TPR) repeat protein
MSRPRHLNRHPYETNIGILIRENGYTQQEMARSLDIPYHTLNSYVRGVHVLPSHIRHAIANVLGCPSTTIICQKNTLPLEDSLFSHAPSTNLISLDAISDHQNMVQLFPEIPIPKENTFEMHSSTHERPDIVFYDQLKLASIYHLVQLWKGRARYCDELQSLIHQELLMVKQISLLADDPRHQQSRRSVLKAIAMLPVTLAGVTSLSLIQKGPIVFPHPEEFLPSCTASIASCWNMLNEKVMQPTEITQLIQTYFSHLLSLASTSGRYQRESAQLAAQAALILDLTTYHQRQFDISLTYAQQAVELANVAMDPTLSAYAYILLGAAYGYQHQPQPQAMLKHHLFAVQVAKNTTSAVQSYDYAELAYSYAHHQNTPETIKYIEKAQTCFPASGKLGDIPEYIAGDFGYHQLKLFEGRSYLLLARQSTTDNEQHGQYQKAEAAFADISIHQNTTQTNIPSRFIGEITNVQAKAAIGIKDLELAATYMQKGFDEADRLQSDKRYGEAEENWQQARSIWPDEQKITALEHYIRPSA